MDDWFLPENLKHIEIERMKSYDRGDIDLSGDFDSYRKLYEDGKESNITSHNAIGNYAKSIAKVVSENIHKTDGINKIADIGGGTGGVARELKAIFKEAEIFSYDLAIYATKWGKENVKDVCFINMAIDESTIFKEGKFDLLFANEFYPFTRTTDFLIQKRYIDMCFNNCNEGGFIILGMPESNGGQWRNLMTDNEDKVIDIYGDLYKGKKSIEGYLQCIMVFKNDGRI